MTIAILGIDLGKNSCSLVGQDATGRVVLRGLSRTQCQAAEGSLPFCFHALFACGSPKQSARRRFCSRTVHAPAKPKPFRSQSMASKPQIVRRAVWKEAEAADPGHVLLDPEVVALDALLQMFGDVVERRVGQKTIALRSHDRGWIGAGTIRADPIGRKKWLIRQHLTEEPLGRVEIAVSGEEEVDWVAVLVDSSVEVAPLTTHLDVGLIDPDRPAVRLAKLAQPLLDQRRVGEHPTVQGAVVHLDPALQEQLLDVTIAQRVTQVPGDGLNDQGRLVVPALEIGFGALLQLRGYGGQDHGVASETGGAMRALWSTRGKRHGFATGPFRMPSPCPT